MKTTTRYQAQLPMTTRRFKPLTPPPPPRPTPPPPPDLAHQLQRRIEHVLMEGFWFCTDCDAMCDRIEGENGQPAHCDRCHGPHIVWNPPIDHVLQPEAA